MQEVFVWTPGDVVGLVCLGLIGAGAVLGVAFIGLQALVEFVRGIFEKNRGK